jgi:hypothetical protein
MEQLNREINILRKQHPIEKNEYFTEEQLRKFQKEMMR